MGNPKFSPHRLFHSVAGNAWQGAYAAESGRRSVLALVIIWAGSLGLSSCTGSKSAILPDLPLPPGRTQLRIGYRYLFHSDVPLAPDHPVLQEVARLPERIQRELHLGDTGTLVQVYLFADRGAYERYLHAHFRHLPPRRAFFMARPAPPTVSASGQATSPNHGSRQNEELLVFAFWGDRILEDLRHELTHAELHSVCPNIPMWLDEGLAEFFEVPAEQDGIHYRHLAALRSELATPWFPSLERLEQLTLLSELTPQDHREAWAWVHFLLRGPACARSLLLNYLQELRETSPPAGDQAVGRITPFSVRLRQVLPQPEAALRQHLNELDHRSARLTLDSPAPR